MKFQSLGGNPVQNHFGWAQRVSTESNTQKRFKVEGVSANVAINPITCVPDASKYMGSTIYKGFLYIGCNPGYAG